ncbi:MAG: hypothetical protein ACYDHC_13915 [Desulfuromonadaceae bacterium]
MKTIAMLVVAIVLSASQCVFAEDGQAKMATVSNVREVFRIITIREPITATEEVCEGDSGIGGAILGGVVGGVIGSRFGRGGGSGAMTALGVAAGAVTGQSVARGAKCYPRERINYIEHEQEVLDGFIVTIESGEEFRTKTRYHVGDRVRIRSSIE